MIPKIIHYCWLSKDQIPDNMKKWMESWKKLRGYEFILWNFDRFDENSSVWVKQAFDAKKYAFAADYIRAFALYNYGGIYMDMDVEVIKPFDDLLDNDYLLAEENPFGLEAGIMGASKGCPLFKDVLDWYNARHFLDKDGKIPSPPPNMPKVIQSVWKEKYELCRDWKTKSPKFDGKTIYIYPWYYFTSRDYPFRDIVVKPESYTIHHFAGSWIGSRKGLKFWIKQILGKKITRKIILLKHINDKDWGND
ncbi:glycosyltransferase family 32 protein [Prevotella sp. OH937_COT-195]|uniref:glycosyltransferase family 32 protein n=1 Tax=Prevotella sp. OH937_COT-195 TaxID=2491051 RepID=UPI001F281196|nr:glycosyltransferase [Prevotella sp. OH937_COT-195]